MAGPEEPKVAVVQGSQLGLVEPFGYSKDSRVHEPYVGIRVTVTDLADAPVILGSQVLDAIGSSDDVIKKGHQHARVQAGVDRVVHFD